jgi:ketosteroid isomerase-like protein
MSEENVERARRGYAAFNDAYRTGDFLPVIEEYFDPDVVLKPAGILPEGATEIRGLGGLLDFTKRQAEAFEDLSLTPERFIAAGDRVIAPLKLGGRARFTGLPVEFSIVHMATYREGKVLRIDVYASLAEALEAAGLSE